MVEIFLRSPRIVKFRELPEGKAFRRTLRNFSLRDLNVILESPDELWLYLSASLWALSLDYFQKRVSSKYKNILYREPSRKRRIVSFNVLLILFLYPRRL